MAKSEPTNTPSVETHKTWLSRRSLMYIIGILLILSALLTYNTIRLQNEISRISEQNIEPANESTDLIDTSEEVEMPSSISPINGTAIIESKSVLINIPTQCRSVFQSRLLEMSFEYNNCIWEVSERSTENNMTSQIIFKHKTTSNEVFVNAYEVGMGGGYPECVYSGNITVINNDFVRFQTSESDYNFVYLNKNHEFGIKDFMSQRGNDKYTEYFNFLNPEAYTNTNLCLRQGGMTTLRVANSEQKLQQYSVEYSEMLDPEMSYQEQLGYLILRDILVEFNTTSEDTSFFSDADNLAVTIYSQIISRN